MDKKRRKVSKAAKIVLRDLRKIELFRGVYDARGGNDKFMYGVETVMESLAYRAGTRIGDKFTDEFGYNMTESMEKAGLFDD